MANLSEEILVTLQGRDNASSVVNDFANSTQSTLNGIGSGAVSSAQQLGGAYTSTFDTINTGIHQLNSGMISLSSVSGMMMRELGAYKSAMEYVYGTTSAEDTNKVLVQTWGDTKTTWEEIYDTVDKVTDNSLTSMQDLIPAMNAFKAATEATGTQLKDSVAEDMAQFGAYVLALTGSEQLARTAMTDLSKGLVGKGSFNALDQYGVTKASLMKQGWSGKNEDIAGYMQAVRRISGAVEDLMDTNAGLDAQLGKMWSRAGKRIGHEVMPGLKSLKTMFMELDNEMDGNLSTAILRVGLAVEETHQKVFEFNTLFDATRNLISVGKTVWRLLTTETNNNSVATQANSDELEYNTQKLLENTDAKYANADASLAMGGATGTTVWTDGVPTTYTGGSEELSSLLDSNLGANVASDVIGNRLYNDNITQDQTLQDKLTRELAKNPNITKTSRYDALLKSLRDYNPIVGGGLPEGKTPSDYLQNNPDLLSPPVFYSTDDLDVGILGTGKPMGIMEPKNLNEYNEYLEGLLGNIPEAPKITNQSEYGKLWKQITDNSSLSNKELTEAFEKMSGDSYDSLSKLKVYSEVQSYHRDRISEAFAKKFELKDLGHGDDSPEIKIMDSIINEHKTQSKKLSDLLDTDDFMGNLERMVRDEGKDDVVLAKALSNEEATKTLSQAFKNKAESTEEGLLRTGGRIKNAPTNSYKRLTDSYKGVKQSILNFGKTAEEIENATDKGILSRLDFALGKPFRKIPDVPADSVLTALNKQKVTYLLMAQESGMISKEIAKTAIQTAIANGEMTALEAEEAILALTTGEVATGSQVVAKESEIAAEGMTEAEAGVTWMGLAESGLAGAFHTLIVPTLAIAGVIAILIPVIAGLAIEAMFFINIVGQMMEAMNFDDIDLDGAVEGLQSLAEGFAWLGVAMGALTFAGIMSQLTLVTSGLFIMLNGFPFVVDMITTLAEQIKPLESVSIDESVAENLQNFASVMGSIALAMLSMVGVQLTSWIAGIVTGFGRFGTLTDSINRAKDDIQQAVNAINDLNVGGIDENKVNQLKTTLEAIQSFADAFSSLAGMRTNEAISDFTSWLLDGGFFGNGGRSISEAIKEAEKDITEASSALANFTKVSDIDETTVDRLTKAGEGIKAMGDAFEGLRKIRDDKNWDAMFDEGGIFGFLKGDYDIEKALNEAKDDIIKISRSLKTLDGKLADIPDNVSERLTKVGDTLTAISNAIEGLKKIKEAGGKKNKNFDKYVETIKVVRTDLIKVSKELKKFAGNDSGEGGLEDLTESGIDTKINTLTGTLANIGEAVANLSNLSTQTKKGTKLPEYASMIKTVRSELVKVSQELKKFSSGDGEEGKNTLEDISGLGIDGKLQAIATTLENVSNAITQLSNINANIGDGTKMETYASMIENAKVGLSKISKKLVELNDGGEGSDPLSSIPEGLDTKIHAVTHTLAEIAMAFDNLKKLYKQQGSQDDDGYQEYVDMIENAKFALKDVSDHLHQLGEGDNAINTIDEGLPSKIQRVTDTLSAVDGALAEMQAIFTSFGGSGEQPGSGKTLNLNMGTANLNQGKNNETLSNIDQYKTTIENAKTALISVSGTLKGLNSDKGGLEDVSGVAGKVNSVRRALTALKNSASVMSKFPKIDGHVVGYNVGRAVTGLKRASTQMKQLNDNDKVGENITSIIANIDNAVKKLKESLKNMDFAPEGESIGSKIKTGIGTGLNDLSGTVANKINSVASAVTASATSLGTSIATSVKTAFENGLTLSAIVSAKLQEAKVTADTGVTVNSSTSGSTSSSDSSSSGSSSSSGFNLWDMSTWTSSTSDNQNPGSGIRDIAGTTRRMVNNLNNSAYNSLNLNKLNQNRIDSLNNMNKKSTMGAEKQNVTFNIGDGAIQLDARNLTVKESRQVMINALEGLNMIKGVKF